MEGYIGFNFDKNKFVKIIFAMVINNPNLQTSLFQHHLLKLLDIFHNLIVFVLLQKIIVK